MLAYKPPLTLAVEANGKSKRIQVHYKSIGTAKRGTIFFFHGIMTSAAFFDPVLESKLASQYKLYALTFPWFKEHNELDEDVCSFEGLTDLVKSFIAYFKVKGPAFIIGHSLGANIVLNALTDESFSKKITKAVLICGFLQRRKVNILTRMYAHVPKFIGGRVWLLGKIVHAAKLSAARNLFAAFSTVSSEMTKIALRTAAKVAHKRDLREDLEEINKRVPILWVQGASDMVVKHDADVPSSVESITFQAGHMIPRVKTEEFVDKVSRFFS